MTYHILNLSSKKAQFFILTTVVIVGVFYSLSKSIGPYSFVDTSTAAYGGEILFFDNVKDKALKTIKISSPEELENNLHEYKDFVEEIASDKGYSIVFNYIVGSNTVSIDILLTSQKYTLQTTIIYPDIFPICENAEINGLCDGLDIAYGVGFRASCCRHYGLCC